MESNISSELVQPVISKKQLKKLKREEHWVKNQDSIKEKWKLKKKLQKVNRKNKKKDTAKDTNIDFKSLQNGVLNKKALKLSRIEEFKLKLENSKQQIIIDCDFNSYMQNKEVQSLCGQIVRCHSVNKSLTIPFHIFLYNVSAMLHDQLMKAGLEFWQGVTCILKDDKQIDFDMFLAQYKIQKEKIIYLTGDSSNEICNITEDQILVIGGIVDRNRHKGLTLTKADELGLNHARLPIGDYINLKVSKILATNHVFEIIGFYQENKYKTEDVWKESFLSIIPKRKFNNTIETNKISLSDEEDEILLLSNTNT